MVNLKNRLLSFKFPVLSIFNFGMTYKLRNKWTRSRRWVMLKIKTQLQVDILFQWDETIVTGHWSSLTLTAQSISQSYSSFFFVNNIFVQNNWNLNPGILRGSSLQSQAINLKLLTHAWTSLFFCFDLLEQKNVFQTFFFLRLAHYIFIF